MVDTFNYFHKLICDSNFCLVDRNTIVNPPTMHMTLNWCFTRVLIDAIGFNWCFIISSCNLATLQKFFKKCQNRRYYRFKWGADSVLTRMIYGFIIHQYDNSIQRVFWLAVSRHLSVGQIFISPSRLSCLRRVHHISTFRKSLAYSCKSCGLLKENFPSKFEKNFLPYILYHLDNDIAYVNFLREWPWVFPENNLNDVIICLTLCITKACLIFSKLASFGIINLW